MNVNITMDRFAGSYGANEYCDWYFTYQAEDYCRFCRVCSAVCACSSAASGVLWNSNRLHYIHRNFVSSPRGTLNIDVRCCPSRLLNCAFLLSTNPGHEVCEILPGEELIISGKSQKSFSHRVACGIKARKRRKMDR